MSADSGNSHGQDCVGISLHGGFGISAGSKKAIEYYKLSMGQGDADGQCDCGFCLGTGFHLSKDAVNGAEFERQIFFLRLSSTIPARVR
jgi:TPR repeat protein